MIANEVIDRARHPVPASASRAAPTPGPRTCAVSLVDRRTGTLHRVNGTTVTLYTQTPDLAVANLLQGRDSAVWEARIQPLEPEHRR